MSGQSNSYAILFAVAQQTTPFSSSEEKLIRNQSPPPQHYRQTQSSSWLNLTCESLWHTKKEKCCIASKMRKSVKSCSESANVKKRRRRKRLEEETQQRVVLGFISPLGVLTLRVRGWWESLFARVSPSFLCVCVCVWMFEHGRSPYTTFSPSLQVVSLVCLLTPVGRVVATLRSFYTAWLLTSFFFSFLVQVLKNDRRITLKRQQTIDTSNFLGYSKWFQVFVLTFYEFPGCCWPYLVPGGQLRGFKGVKSKRRTLDIPYWRNRQTTAWPDETATASRFLRLLCVWLLRSDGRNNGVPQTSECPVLADSWSHPAGAVTLHWTRFGLRDCSRSASIFNSSYFSNATRCWWWPWPVDVQVGGHGSSC